MPHDESVDCIVFGCALAADQVLTFRVEELQLVYAVCEFHSCDLRRAPFSRRPSTPIADSSG